MFVTPPKSAPWCPRRRVSGRRLRACRELRRCENKSGVALYTLSRDDRFQCGEPFCEMGSQGCGKTEGVWARELWLPLSERPLPRQGHLCALFPRQCSILAAVQWLNCTTHQPGPLRRQSSECIRGRLGFVQAAPEHGFSAEFDSLTASRSLSYISGSSQLQATVLLAHHTHSSRAIRDQRTPGPAEAKHSSRHHTPFHLILYLIS